MQIFYIIFLFINVLHSAIGNLCSICECLQSDNIMEYNCNGKLDLTTDVLDIFLFINENSPIRLTLSNNKINGTSLKKLKYLSDLQYLNLSHNALQHIDADFFHQFPRIIELDLSYNNIEHVNIEILEKASSLKMLDLSHNRIKNMNGSVYFQSNLQDLDLSHNSLGNISHDFIMTKFLNLKSLNLAYNSFDRFFINMPLDSNLILLNLDHNLINTVSINAPNLDELYIGYNELKLIPKNLSVSTLSIENNNIEEITYDEELFNNLEYLNISFNSLTSFPNFTFAELEELDISYNKYITIPDNLMSVNLPKLRTLVINGNPIKEIKFTNHLKLFNFVMKETELLNAIYKDAFDKLRGWHDYCINLTISFNKNLISFDEDALYGLNICYLDLSNNGLSRISEKLENVWNGSLPKYGVNLQGNPFNCDCRAEWMLKKLVSQISEIDSELLIDLRCAKPSRLSNRRMAHWLKWEEEIFCDENIMENEFSRLEIFDGREEFINFNRKELSLKSGSGMLFIIIGSAVSLLVLVVVGLAVSYKLALRRRRFNRRL